MKTTGLALLLCSMLCACATARNPRHPSLLEFDELGAHISVTRESVAEADAATVASR